MVSDAHGIPLASCVTAANVHDSHLVAPLLDAIPALKTGRVGRPRHRPGKLHADKGYDYARCRAACRCRGVMPRIARRGIESKTKPGRHRWVIERRFAWLAQKRRWTIRYERFVALHHAFLHLGCAMVCFKLLDRF